MRCISAWPLSVGRLTWPQICCRERGNKLNASWSEVGGGWGGICHCQAVGKKGHQ